MRASVAVGNRVQSAAVPLPRIPAGVVLIGGLALLTLLLVADRYGYLGDEFYFVVTGRHLQVAAPDNPMLVPHLAAGWYAVVGAIFGRSGSSRRWRLAVMCCLVVLSLGSSARLAVTRWRRLRPLP